MINFPIKKINYNFEPKKRICLNDSVDLELKELTKLIDEKRKSQGRKL